MADLVLPDSNFFISRARAGTDPFQKLAAHADDWEFATCGMVILEVGRGRRDPELLRRFRERFAVMLYVATGRSIWERAGQLAWSLDRKGLVLPSPDLVIAACALQAGSAVLTSDAHFRAIPGLRVVEHLQ
jgi:predicted nucleic acid-binding protein